MGELAGVCQAAARVKFFDASFFDAVKSHLQGKDRGRLRHKPADIIGIIAGLAEINSYNEALFEAAGHALSGQEGQLDGSMRRQMLRAFSASGHQSDLPLLKTLAQQEKDERYKALCEESATAWQKRDKDQRKREFWWT